MRIEKTFLKKLFIIALPIILQELLNALVGFIDTFMIGQLGEISITSVGLSNQIFFLFSLFLFGVDCGSSIFIAQYWGKKEVENIHKVMGIHIILNIFISSLFFLASVFMPHILMKIYSNDIEVINQGIKYLRIISLTYFLVAFIRWNNISLQAIKLTKYPMITTLISLITNTILNYIFIFKLDYGILGAGVATLCARIVELISQQIILRVIKSPTLNSIKNYFNYSKEFLKNYLAITTPILINEILWATGVSLYNSAYKFCGTESQAAVQIATTVEKLFIVCGLGIGTGCGIILSNTLGAGKVDKAKVDAKKCLVITFIFSLLMSSVLILLSTPIINLFNVEDNVKVYSKNLLYIVAIGIILKSYNYAGIIGIMRSGGDTKWALIIDSSCVWLVGLPMAYIGAYTLGLPIHITFTMVYLEEVVRCIVTTLRLKQDKWANVLV